MQSGVDGLPLPTSPLLVNVDTGKLVIHNNYRFAICDAYRRSGLWGEGERMACLRSGNLKICAKLEVTSAIRDILLLTVRGSVVGPASWLPNPPFRIPPQW